jgi:hypothetical protein
VRCKKTDAVRITPIQFCVIEINNWSRQELSAFVCVGKDLVTEGSHIPRFLENI